MLRKIFETSDESEDAESQPPANNQLYYLPLFRLQTAHPFFRKFSVEAVSAILQLGRIILLKPNQVLYKQND